MDYVDFGSNGMRASEVVMGFWRIPDKTSDEVATLVEAGVDAGVNMLDVADAYGRGACERILGDALSSRPGLRDRVLVQTKCGIVKGDGFTWYDFSRTHIVEAVKGSLARLGTDHVDSLLLHRPDVLMEPDEIAAAFDELRASGKVLEFGVSNLAPAGISRIQASLDFPLACNQIQLSCGHTAPVDATIYYNMGVDEAVSRDAATLDWCAAHGMVVQSWSSLQVNREFGTFLGASEYAALNDSLDRIAADRGVTPAAVALAWILRLPMRTQAVIGTCEPTHAREAAAASDVRLTRREWYEIYSAAGHRLP